MIRYKNVTKLLIPLLLILIVSYIVINRPDKASVFTGGYVFGQWLGKAKRPFPQHVSYTPGTIKPNVDQERMDKATEVFYEAWKARYLKDDCGSDQIYVWFDSAFDSGNASLDSISVSEGQGYGMIIVAYMAGHDSDAKKIFDGLYNFYRAHISNKGGSSLMAWNQVAGCRNAPKTNTGDGNYSSTDADIDIAYALLLAHNQWGSNGMINYLGEAKKLIRDIMRYEVNSDTWTPNLGNWISPSDPFFFDTRTSDFIVNHFRHSKK
ncbi:glycosyl hydrolase family 8 [Desulfosediminicola ganghwensis]|uniref:glycosyl hydrolase family 8 n=1 Tax=Desulfosediminicola ganghwensis TaxID=2569540 RepID=UPI0010ACCA22|nr:glycosyl hydrolase family 8 [Desulfosediminicola ganghwensis]